MKIDLEGYESLVLDGASETLLRDKTVVLLELHRSNSLAPHGLRRVPLMRSLLQRGFRIYFMGHQRRGTDADVEPTAAAVDEQEEKYETIGVSLVILTSDDIRASWPGLAVAL